MTDKPAGFRQPPGTKPPAKSERLAREAAALRENLRKRKAQARAKAGRAAPPADADGA